MLHKPNFYLTKQSFLLVIALFNHNVLAGNDLPEFSANYAIKRFGIKLADANYQLSHTEKGYKITQNTQLAGIASMFRDDTVSAVSYINKDGDELLLQSHRYTLTGKEKNKDEDYKIQWDTSINPAKGKITGIAQSKKVDLNTDAAIWDALSFQVPLMIEANKNKKEYPYKAILKGEINTYHFKLKSNKQIIFADKEYLVLQMVRIDPKRDRQLHIWLAPELHNFPIIIENYRDGKIHSLMQLERLQFNKEKPLREQTMDSDDDF